jgi:hypothetical protein
MEGQDMTDIDMTEDELDEILDDAALPEVTVPLCVRNDLQQQFEAAEQRLADALQAVNDADSLGGSPGDLEGLAAEIETIRQAMAKRTIKFRFQARDKTRWSRMIAEHPPREDDERDKPLGLNIDTFFTQLIKESTVSPKMTGARWDKLLPTITDGQWDVLTNTLWSLNRQGQLPIPFSAAASRILRNSATASKQRQDSDSL